MSPTKDYYKVLKVIPNAGQIQIKRAYCRLAVKWHPGQVSPAKIEEAEKVFREIVEAYFVLGNKESRKVYDHQRATENSVMKPSEIWNFVEPSLRLFDPDTFNYFYNEQHVRCDAFELDWRVFFGGMIARTLAVMVFLLLFTVGHGLLPPWSLIDFGNNVQLPWPALIAVSYIYFETFRDFVWEYIGENEMVDVYVLAAAWLVVAMSTVIVVATLTMPPPAPAPPEEKEGRSRLSAVPVNLEVFNVKPPPDPDAKHKMKRGGGGI